MITAVAELRRRAYTRSSHSHFRTLLLADKTFTDLWELTQPYKILVYIGVESRSGTSRTETVKVGVEVEEDSPQLRLEPPELIEIGPPGGRRLRKSENSQSAVRV